MIVDKSTTILLSSSVNQNIPDPCKGVAEASVVEGIEIRFLRDAVPLGFNSAVTLPYAVAALRNGDYIAAAAIEREDLRELSRMMGVSAKTLQEEYGTKGYLLEPRTVLYGEGESEDLGHFTLSLDEETAKAFLYETVLDMLDILDE